MKNIEMEMNEGKGLINARHSFERAYILQALQKSGWNQTETARTLQIHRNTLLQKLKSLNLKVEPREDVERS